VDRCSIPDYEQLAGNVVHQVTEEAHDFSAPDRMLVHLEVEPLIEELIEGLVARSVGSAGGDGAASYGANDGEVIVREAVMENGRLAHGSVGTSNGRQEVEAALVDEEECSRLSESLIF
jgi:hypothetical protein